MIQEHEITNNEELQKLFPALDGSEKVIEMVVPFGGNKSFYFQHGMMETYTRLRSGGDIVIISYNERQSVFTPELCEQINESISVQKNENKMADMRVSASELKNTTAEDIAMIKGLCVAEASLINQMYSTNEDYGNTALRASIESFETFLKSTRGTFIRGMSIEYRVFVVELLKLIDAPYQASALSKILMS